MDAKRCEQEYKQAVIEARAKYPIVSRYHFDGKVYTQITRTKTIAECEALAEDFRKAGFLARVITLSPTYPAGNPRGYRYAIAVRRKR